MGLGDRGSTQRGRALSAQPLRLSHYRFKFYFLKKDSCHCACACGDNVVCSRSKRPRRQRASSYRRKRENQYLTRTPQSPRVRLLIRNRYSCCCPSCRRPSRRNFHHRFRRYQRRCFCHRRHRRFRRRPYRHGHQQTKAPWLPRRPPEQDWPAMRWPPSPRQPGERFALRVAVMYLGAQQTRPGLPAFGRRAFRSLELSTACSTPSLCWRSTSIGRAARKRG